MTGTYGDMQARIADELARGDLTAQIALAIQSAIKRHERQRLAFNEALASFATVAGQAWYGAADLAAIPDIVAIDSLVLATGGTSTALTRRTIAEIDAADLTPALRGDPTDYAYYRQQLRLWPTPAQARTLTLAYVQRLPVLAAAGDSNAWMTDGEALIRAAAKAELFAHVIRDPAEAAAMRGAETEALAELRADAIERIAAGRLVATRF